MKALKLTAITILVQKLFESQVFNLLGTLESQASWAAKKILWIKWPSLMLTFGTDTEFEQFL